MNSSSISSNNNDILKVIGICGSLRDQSYTRMTLNIALEGASEVGANTELIDLRDYKLVFCKQVSEEDYPDDVRRLRLKVQQADGIILGTPEYHGSFSGVIKNALDLMGFKEFQGKTIGLVGVGGGSLGAINALNGLRGIGRQLHAWVVPKQASIPNSNSQFTNEERLKDSRLEERVKDVGKEVARFSFLHSSREIEQFLLEWETGPQNPGGS